MMTREEVQKKYRSIRRRLGQAKTETKRLAIEEELAVLQETCAHPMSEPVDFGDEEDDLPGYCVPAVCPDCRSEDC